jgi:hypothetical protein
LGRAFCVITSAVLMLGIDGDGLERVEGGVELILAGAVWGVVTACLQPAANTIAEARHRKTGRNRLSLTALLFISSISFPYSQGEALSGLALCFFCQFTRTNPADIK